MKALFCACVGLSVGLHGVLALGWRAPPATGAASGASAAHRPATGLQARLVALPRPMARPTPGPPADMAATAMAAAEAAAPAPQEPSTAALAVAALAMATHAPVAATPAAMAPPPAFAPAAVADVADVVDVAEARDDAHAVVATAIVADRAIDPPTDSDDDTGAAVAGWDGYLPRPLLTVAPQPREVIVLDYPGDGPTVGRFVLTLTLYIDQTGQVRRVDVAPDEAIPATLHLAARASFSDRRFSPGELAGAAVRSRIRVEAVFESLALPSLAARGDAVVATNATPTATAHTTRAP